MMDHGAAKLPNLATLEALAEAQKIRRLKKADSRNSWPFQFSLVDRSGERLVNSIRFFLGSAEGCDDAKLVQLLYDLDSVHLEQTGRSVTGLVYDISPERTIVVRPISGCGPWPSEILRTQVLSAPFDDTHLTRRQLKIMRSLADQFQVATSNDALFSRVGDQSRGA
jgi:hypothetical protein